MNFRVRPGSGAVAHEGIEAPADLGFARQGDGLLEGIAHGQVALVDERREEAHHARQLGLGQLSVFDRVVDAETDLAVFGVHLDLQDLGFPVQLVDRPEHGELSLGRGVLGQAISHGRLDAEEFAVLFEPEDDVHAEVAVVVLVEVRGKAGADEVILETVFDAGGVEESGEFADRRGHDVIRGWKMKDG
jgi:hypothetical protein